MNVPVTARTSGGLDGGEVDGLSRVQTLRVDPRRDDFVAARDPAVVDLEGGASEVSVRSLVGIRVWVVVKSLGEVAQAEHREHADDHEAGLPLKALSRWRGVRRRRR